MARKKPAPLMPRGQRLLDALLSPNAPSHNAAACKSLQSVLLHHCAPAEGQEQELVGTCSELIELYTRQCASYDQQQKQAPTAMYLPPVG